MIADLIKDISYPKTIKFTVLASMGFFEGTFARTDPYKRRKTGIGMKVIGTHIPNTELYDVIATSPQGKDYPYLMPYQDLLAWSKDTSGSYYNDKIRGKFRPN